MASTYLTRTFGTATSQKIGTFSFWIKISKLGSSGDKYIFSTYENDNNRTICKLNGNDQFEFQARSGGNVDLRFDTNRVFRDTSAWYHIVITTDTTLSTAADRVKIYVNGVQETSFATSTIPTQNIQPHYLYNNLAKVIGAYANGNVNNFDGLMSHFHFTDGYAYDASAFGEFDANGVWKINTSPSVTYGNNGFFILKNGNSVTDQSGNSNNYTVGGGTLTNTEDCPSNVFATLNPLDRAINGTAPTFAYGNTQWTASGNSTSNNAVRGTLGNSNGKYYFEAKLLEATNTMIGVHLTSVSPFYDGDGYMGSNSGFYAIYINGLDAIYAIVGGSNQNVNLGSVTNNDIIGCAFDFDNNKFYFSKNGTWLNSGDPTSGATGTGSFGTLASGLYVPGITNVSWTTASSTAFNFGNGYFGTTAVSSAGTNASGIGIFEYDVPTGYTALSTKGLNL